jgi:DNA-binding MarR family transcriptional regulator
VHSINAPSSTTIEPLLNFHDPHSGHCNPPSGAMPKPNPTNSYIPLISAVNIFKKKAMDLRDIRTLTLLREIEKDQPSTQRELAEKLDMSLGLVNLYLKRLAQKSFFKIKTYPKNRVGYLLTPQGILEKTRLTYEYISQSLGFYTQIRTKLNEILHQLESQDVRTLAFFKVNEIAEIAYLSIQETKIELVAVIDNAKVGEKFMGFTIMSSASISSISFDRLLDNSFPPPSGEHAAAESLFPVHREMVISVLK